MPAAKQTRLTDDDHIADFAREHADLSQQAAEAVEQWMAERISASDLLIRLQEIKDDASEMWGDQTATRVDSYENVQRLIGFMGERRGDV